MAKNIAILNLIFLFLLFQANGERTKDKMYEKIDGISVCIRRLNATHQMGCTSGRPSSTGVVHLINSDPDLKFVLETGNANPYVVVLPVDKLTQSLLQKFKQHPDRISGIILHKNITRPEKFSHEMQCPNKYSGLENSCSADKPWNPFGTGILQDDIPFPIFLLQDNENLEKITKCFYKFNDFDRENQNLRSLCSLELASFMFATLNSQTCIRRSHSDTNFTPQRFCDPLASRNIWGSLYPWMDTPSLDAIFLTAKIDTTSLFNDVTPGAVSPVTGLVTLLTTAFLLKNMKGDNDTFNKNIFFVVFNGETYDYIGSQRFVYDIINKEFPMEKDPTGKDSYMSLSNIKLLVELDQLSQKKPELFTHHIRYDKKDQIDSFKKTLSEFGTEYGLTINQPAVDKRLPPSSLQSFLVEKDTIEGLVLSDYNQSYSNNFYHSLYDDKENIDYVFYNTTADNETSIPNDSIQAYLANISVVLAKSLFYEATGNSRDISVDVPQIVDELLHCYINTANCSLYKAITLKDDIGEKPFSLYVGVEPIISKVTTLTGYTLAWLTGDITNITQENCSTDSKKPGYRYVWMSKNLTDMNATACYQTTMNFSSAISPAFIIEDYDWHSAKYSTWTESVWNDLYMRMFLKPSRRHEIMTISVGTVTFVLSMALVYFMKTRADILFAKPETIAPGTSC